MQPVHPPAERLGWERPFPGSLRGVRAWPSWHLGPVQAEPAPPPLPAPRESLGLRALTGTEDRPGGRRRRGRAGSRRRSGGSSPAGTGARTARGTAGTRAGARPDPPGARRELPTSAGRGRAGPRLGLGAQGAGRGAQGLGREASGGSVRGPRSRLARTPAVALEGQTAGPAPLPTRRPPPRPPPLPPSLPPQEFPPCPLSDLRATPLPGGAPPASTASPVSEEERRGPAASKDAPRAGPSLPLRRQGSEAAAARAQGSVSTGLEPGREWVRVAPFPTRPIGGDSEQRPPSTDTPAPARGLTSQNLRVWVKRGGPPRDGVRLSGGKFKY